MRDASIRLLKRKNRLPVNLAIKKEAKLTFIEYAVPRMKLTKRAQNNGQEPTTHPIPKLCNVNYKNDNVSHIKFSYYIFLLIKVKLITVTK